MIDKRIIGTWQLKSTKGVDDTGRVMPPPFGSAPYGVVCFQADGRMCNVICDGRAELPAGEMRQFMSYAGNYAFDGTTLTTRVDASSDASRIGGDQVRTVRFEIGGMVLAPTRRLYDLFWAIHSMKDQNPPDVVALSAKHEVMFLPPPPGA